MNTVKCGDCKFYDPLVSGHVKRPAHGWCAARSTYPMKEGPGQVFPPGVKRMTSEGKPSKPFIVTGAGIVETCTQVVRK